MNNSASLLITRICSVPNERNDDCGAEFLRDSANIRAAVVALSVADVSGMFMSCRKNSTVCAICSALVLVMYIVWH